jgi:hypothetical protein
MTKEERWEKFKAENPEGLSKPCNIPECERPSSNRGMCSGHYNSARVLIREGKVTVETLIANKLMNESRVGKSRNSYADDIMKSVGLAF